MTYDSTPHRFFLYCHLRLITLTTLFVCKKCSSYFLEKMCTMTRKQAIDSFGCAQIKKRRRALSDLVSKHLRADNWQICLRSQAQTKIYLLIFSPACVAVGFRIAAASYNERREDKIRFISSVLWLASLYKNSFSRCSDSASNYSSPKGDYTVIDT